MNNAINTDPIYNEYKTRNLVTPVTGFIEYDLYRKNWNYLGFAFKAGAAHVQNIHKYSAGFERVTRKWTGMFELTVYVQIGIAKRGPMFLNSFGRTVIDGKSMYSDYFNLHTFHL